MTSNVIEKTASNSESEVEQQESEAEASQENDDIRTTIRKKIKSIEFLRGVRIQLCNRLENYSRKWKFILFFMNVEAVIIVLLSLTNAIETIQIGRMNMSFDLISGIFTLYVILLQYYINSLNYSERSLRGRYHELELEDLNQELKMLSIKMNTEEIEMSEKEIIESYKKLVDQYQLAVKNNENHRDLEFKRTIYAIKLKAYERGKSKEKPEGQPPKDFTLDMALIYANTLLSIVMLFVICYVVIF